MRRNGLAKNQHYVPRFILKRFVERKEQVWVFDKRTKKRFRTNIKNIAAQSGFYDFDLKGEKLTIEPSLSEIEGKVSAIIKKIVRTESLSMDEAERGILSRFFALQFVRTPQWRNMYQDLQEALAESLRSRGSDPMDVRGFDEGTEETRKLDHMRDIYNHAEYAPHFFSKVWVLLKTSQKDPFWVSDNPIVLQNMKHFGPRGNLGLAVEGIEMYFPISRTLSIALWCPSLKEEIEHLYQTYQDIKKKTPWLLDQAIKDPEHLESLKVAVETGAAAPSRPENVVNHNSLQVKYSSRFVFSSTDDFSLLEEMLQAHPEMQEGPKIEVS